MAKTKPQGPSGSNKRKRRAKRLACNKRLSIAMNQFILRTEDSGGDSKDLPDAKIPSPAKEEEIDSESEHEKNLSSSPVPEVEIQNDFDSNFKVLASVPDEEIRNNDFDSNFEVLTSVPDPEEFELQENKSECEKQSTCAENIYTNS